eukprot:757893-Amphidinium_carterae.2
MSPISGLVKHPLQRTDATTAIQAKRWILLGRLQPTLSTSLSCKVASCWHLYDLDFLPECLEGCLKS